MVDSASEATSVATISLQTEDFRSLSLPAGILAFLVRIENDRTAITTQLTQVRHRNESDHRYGLPTVALFMTGIILFSIGYLVTVFIVPRSKWHQNGLLRKTLAVSRYLSYRGYRISSLRWNSAPLGILFLGAVGIIFFFSPSSIMVLPIVLVQRLIAIRYDLRAQTVLLAQHKDSHIWVFTPNCNQNWIHVHSMHTIHHVRVTA